MTVSEMDTRLSRLLGDTSGHAWTQTAYRLPALNSAQINLVIRILGYGSQFDSAYDLLTDIQRSDVVTIDTTGVDLDALEPNYEFMRNGYVASKVIVDQKTKWVRRRPIRNLAEANNRFLKGSNIDPACYILNNVYYLDIDTGYYPVSGTIYWIHKPYTMVISDAGTGEVTTCQLSGSFHELIVSMAVEECYRMVGDDQNMNRYTAISKENDARIQEIVMGSVGEPKESGKK